MKDLSLENIREQHKFSYKSSIKEVIKNNNISLFDEDIMLLFRTPPLDSMDNIKSKFLDTAKSNGVIFNSDVLNSSLDIYRKKLIKQCNLIKNERLNYLVKLVDDYELLKDNDVIKFNKKCFVEINKIIKTSFKDALNISYEKTISKNIDKIIFCEVDVSLKKKMIADINKFIKSIYNKQIIDSINIKIMVKDNSLMNGINEQSERYLFTIGNSRLLNNN